MEAEGTATPVQSGPPRWLRPLGVRLLALLVVFGIVDIAFAALNVVAAKNAVTGLISGIATAAVALFLYSKIVGWLEERETPEVGREKRWPHLLRGLALGAGLFTLVLLLIAMCNGYRAGWGSFGDMVSNFGLMIGVATCEELLFRGVMFRIIEEWAGTIIAIVASSVFFGGLHLLNPSASLWGAVAIALQGGMLSAAAFVLTRKMWLPIGFHLGWNFAQGGIFGATVSGSADGGHGLLHGSSHGADIISGGSFGPEASIFAVLAGAIAAIVMFRMAYKQGKFIKPSWR
jgi:membrane protease YdiL (CAAX protease family)